MPERNIYVFSADHSGLPLSQRFQEEGHGGALVLIPPEWRCGKLEKPKDAEEEKKNQERMQYLRKNGNGIVKKMWVDEAMKIITPKDFVIFDQIYGWNFGEALFRRGVPVLGGAKIGYLLETERIKTLKKLGSMGYDIPAYKSFGPGSSQEAIKFLQAEKDEILYALKSDSPAVEVSVAKESNDELILKLTAEKKEIDADGLILQEKKTGIEIAAEVWCYEGKPIFANIDLEGKKLYNETDDPQTGCVFNLLWPVPVNHPLIERLIKPMQEFIKAHIGTGLMDISVIYDPHEDKMWVLEVCGSRFAYNALYTCMALCQMPLGEFFIKYLKGEFKGDIAGKALAGKYAASVRVFNHGNASDRHIVIPEAIEKNFWIWDAHKKGKDLLTTGTDHGESLGVITGTAQENPEGAMAEVRKYYSKFYMPTKRIRQDFDEDDEINLPLARFHAMVDAKLIDDMQMLVVS